MRNAINLMLAMVILLLSVSVAVADHHAVKVADKDGIGRYLVDSEGMTLYWFTKDSEGMSACAGGCLEKWPIYYRPSVLGADGVSSDDFATITRSDGQKQTTFRGYPLYYFFKDNAAGETNGQGVKDVWYVIDPDNFPAMK